MEAKLDEMLAEVCESRKERKELEAQLEEKFHERAEVRGQCRTGKGSTSVF